VLPVTLARTVVRPAVLLLGGSLARPSHTSALLARLERELASRGAAVCRWDLAERPLPFADPAYHHRPQEHPSPAVRQLAAAASAADALVLGSPLYHNSYSALLKNALDLLSTTEAAGKPVGLVSHAGRLPSTQALDHLRLVARGLHGVAIPTQVATIDADYTTTGKRLRLSSAAARDRLGRLADELLWYAGRLGQADGPAPAPAEVWETLCVSG
jgi:azobenzene reductase